MNIPKSEIKYSSLSIIDIGRVFWWQGRLFRGIYKDYVPLVYNLFESGLIPKLIKDSLFVNSWITSFQSEDYGLIVEHEIIFTPVYPREWSFTMLKDAAQLILRLNETSSSFGYQTKDCHCYNILYKNNRPIYVDLGSFVLINTKKEFLLSQKEFLRSYYYPLKIWQLTGDYFGMRVIHRPGLLVPEDAYVKFRWPILRWNGINKLLKNNKNYRKIYNIFYKVNKILFRSQAKISSLKIKVDRITCQIESTKWSSYHDEINFINLENEVISRFDRFNIITQKLISLNIKSILEIGGNQGRLSRLIKHRAKNINVICTDSDHIAIDKGYCHSKKEDIEITWAIHNPFLYETYSCEIKPEIRFKADAVVALALTHHLILSNNYDIEYIFDVIIEYTNKYIFIEFMPMGLYDGNNSHELPYWYNENWFTDSFNKKFELIEKIKLEKNRIIFIGIKKY
jgi:hypothetical protein